MNGYIQGSRSDATRYLVYVLSGALVLLRHTSDGEEVIVHTARSGETLAEAAPFTDHYHCDCKAGEETELVLLPSAVIRNAIRKDQGFAQDFIAHLCHQIISLRTRLELVAITSAKERVFAGLTEGLHTGTIRELAAQVHLTPEATNRSLAQLVKDGRLRKLGRGRYRV